MVFGAVPPFNEVMASVATLDARGVERQPLPRLLMSHAHNIRIRRRQSSKTWPPRSIHDDELMVERHLQVERGA